jgi:hypothetical protein
MLAGILSSARSMALPIISPAKPPLPSSKLPVKELLSAKAVWKKTDKLSKSPSMLLNLIKGTRRSSALNL